MVASGMQPDLLSREQKFWNNAVKSGEDKDPMREASLSLCQANRNTGQGFVNKSCMQSQIASDGLVEKE